MSSLDNLLSFEPELNLKSTPNRSPSDARLNAERNRGQVDESGLNFSQILVDREERAEKIMSSNYEGDEASNASVASGDEESKTISRPDSVSPEAGDLASQSKGTLPAIIAQSLAVQAQLTTQSAPSSPAGEIANPTLTLEQAITKMTATINEAMDTAQASEGKQYTSTETALKPNPVEVPAASSKPVVAQFGPSSGTQNGGETPGVAALKEIETVIQNLADEDADLTDVNRNSKAISAGKPVLGKVETYSALAAMKRPVSLEKPIVSDGQLLSEEEAAAIKITVDTAAAAGDQTNQQQLASSAYVPQDDGTTGAAPAADSSGDIALENVEVTAQAAQPAASTPPTNSANSVATHLDAKATSQVRQQVIHQVSGRIPNLSGQEKLTLNLNPESLGQLEVTFEPKGDRLMVLIVASDSAAAAALQEDVRELTDRIVERSGRFGQVDIKIELKDGAEARQESKENDKNDERQGQKRDQQEKDQRQRDEAGFVHPESLQTRQAWQNALAWQLDEEPELVTVNEEK